MTFSVYIEFEKSRGAAILAKLRSLTEPGLLFSGRGSVTLKLRTGQEERVRYVLVNVLGSCHVYIFWIVLTLSSNCSRTKAKLDSEG